MTYLRSVSNPIESAWCLNAALNFTRQDYIHASWRPRAWCINGLCCPQRVKPESVLVPWVSWVSCNEHRENVRISFAKSDRKPEVNSVRASLLSKAAFMHYANFSAIYHPGLHSCIIETKGINHVSTMRPAHYPSSPLHVHAASSSSSSDIFIPKKILLYMCKVYVINHNSINYVYVMRSG